MYYCLEVFGIKRNKGAYSTVKGFVNIKDQMNFGKTDINILNMTNGFIRCSAYLEIMNTWQIVLI